MSGRLAEPIEVLHEDADIVVAGKPGGLLVHQSRESSDGVFLLQELRNQLGRHLYPVHRLDRAASGAIALAFSSAAARALQERLTAADAIKEYLALVRGSAPESGRSDRPLTGESGRRQDACTSFEKVAELAGLSLLRVRITTGRRHQIRRHLAHLRHQILGDTTYGKGRINRHFRAAYGLPRLFLHAALLDFRHPADPSRVHVHAPLARDLQDFLLRLPGADAAALPQALGGAWRPPSAPPAPGDDAGARHAGITDQRRFASGSAAPSTATERPASKYSAPAWK